MTNKERFLTLYRTELLIMRIKNPQDYVWEVSEFENVYSRMVQAIESKSFNKDSSTFKAVCKKLKIKHTYRDIETFLG